MPRHHRGHQHQRHSVNNERFYTFLGVSKNATPAEIKRAYHQAAKECHPDKHPGDEEKLKKFQALNNIYEILSDPERRRMYDLHGEEAIFEGPRHSHWFPTHGARQERKADNLYTTLPVTIKELYCGATKIVNYDRENPCPTCQGRGFKRGGKLKRCRVCKGTGTKMQQTGKGFVDLDCKRCSGKGTFIDPKFICPMCNGNQVQIQKKQYSVEVIRGMKFGEEIVVSGEGEREAGKLDGDLIVELEEIDIESKFERAGNNLIYTTEIPLFEALMGTDLFIVHLDGRVLKVEMTGEMRDGGYKFIPEEGMPIEGDPFHKGDLFVKFTIIYPKFGSITREEKEQLAALLGYSPQEQEPPKEFEVVNAVDYKPEEHGPIEDDDEEDYDSDDSDPYRGFYSDDEEEFFEAMPHCTHQ